MILLLRSSWSLDTAQPLWDEAHWYYKPFGYGLAMIGVILYYFNRCLIVMITASFAAELADLRDDANWEQQDITSEGRLYRFIALYNAFSTKY